MFHCYRTVCILQTKYTYVGTDACRICQQCNLHMIENEYHFLLILPSLTFWLFLYWYNKLISDVWASCRVISFSWYSSVRVLTYVRPCVCACVCVCVRVCLRFQRNCIILYYMTSQWSELGGAHITGTVYDEQQAMINRVFGNLLGIVVNKYETKCRPFVYKLRHLFWYRYTCYSRPWPWTVLLLRSDVYLPCMLKYTSQV